MTVADQDMMLNERQLFLDFQEGDMMAFNYLFDKYYRGLCLFACRMLVSTAESEDLVQDFFVRILENRKNIRIETSVKSYFIRSVHNRCLDYNAHKKLILNYEQHQLSRMTESDYHDYPLLDNELAQKLDLAIQNLPDGLRYTFLLNRFDGLKYQQIALKENISVKTVEYRISKALDFLRKELSDYLS